jgi:hypothetical protein
MDRSGNNASWNAAQNGQNYRSFAAGEIASKPRFGLRTGA